MGMGLEGSLEFLIGLDDMVSVIVSTTVVPGSQDLNASQRVQGEDEVEDGKSEVGSNERDMDDSKSHKETHEYLEDNFKTFLPQIKADYLRSG